MRTRHCLKKSRIENQAGFTLIEILIVVILLGILATIIIPQVSVSTDDAKYNALKTNLGNIRGAIEIYYYQHGNQYPGQVSAADGTPTGDDAAARLAFIAQLTMYTDVDGGTAVAKNDTYKYGPYLKGGLPSNPYNDNSDVICDMTTNDITAKESSEADNVGWKFYTKTGVLLSDDGLNDGAHDTL